MLSCFSHVWLCDLMVCSPPGSSIHGILQARILEWVAISSSREPSGPRNWTRVSGIGRQILYHWATGKPQVSLSWYVRTGVIKIPHHGTVVIMRWVHLCKMLGTVPDSVPESSLHADSPLSLCIVLSTTTYCYWPGPVLDYYTPTAC